MKQVFKGQRPQCLLMLTLRPPHALGLDLGSLGLACCLELVLNMAVVMMTLTEGMLTDDQQ